MTRPELIQLNIKSSFLCADPDCGAISNDSHHCPRCGSQVLSLARVLERLSDNQQTEATGPGPVVTYPNPAANSTAGAAA